MGCKIVWFGQGEFHLSPGNTVSFIALRPTVERPARPLNEPDDFELTVGKPHFDETLALLADLPMEEKAEIIGRDVWVVYLMVALCVGVSLHPKLSLLGLSSSDPWRYWGLTWLTAVFAHAGWAHLFSNVYFLWLFGDNVETRLGNSRFAELFFLSALVGQATTLIFLKTENVIILGASGGIMGLAVFYALSFPSSRLKLMYPVVTRTGVIVFRLFLPTYVLLAGYLAFEYLLVGKEVSSGIAHTAHLGGAVTGFFYWAFSDRALSASSR